MVKTDSFSRNNFDLLRILAASQVMVAHSFHHLGLDTESAWFQWLDRFPGVPVFFIISGFLVSASLERSKSPADYFTNRFLRIFPASVDLYTADSGPPPIFSPTCLRRCSLVQ